MGGRGGGKKGAGGGGGAAKAAAGTPAQKAELAKLRKEMDKHIMYSPDWMKVKMKYAKLYQRLYPGPKTFGGK